jgi:threonine synthase
MAVSDAAWRRATKLFAGFRLDDAGTEAEMRRLWTEAGYLADPHSAIGIAGGRHLGCHGVPTIAMATAAPAKFPDAVKRATGLAPPLPPRLDDLYKRPERFTRAPNDLAAVEALVRAMAHRNIGVQPT